MERINPWVLERLKRASKRGSSLRFIIEVVPDKRATVKSELAKIPNIHIISQPADRFIVVKMPPELLERVARIEYVVKVSADIPVYITGLPTSLKITDPWVGEIRPSPVEIEFSPVEGLVNLPLIGVRSLEETVYPTNRVRKFMHLPDKRDIKTKVGVADTGGVAPPHIHIHPDSKVEFISCVPYEPSALDNMGHGAHVQTIAFGDEAIHPRYGLCRGMANPKITVAIKCLDISGRGYVSWVLDAVDKAHKAGCKLLNLSLGSELQGSAITDDPLCRLISALKDEMLVVCAAGNEGPSKWTISSPAASPDCVAIGSWCMKTEGAADFSSRGPSGKYYKDHPDAWERDYKLRGEDMIKPDCMAPGGSRTPSEKILAGCSGWLDPIADILPQYGALRGTSMATPAACGTLALAYDRGLIKTASDVKRKLASGKGVKEEKSASHSEVKIWKVTVGIPKSCVTGYGFLTWERLL